MAKGKKEESSIASGYQSAGSILNRQVEPNMRNLGKTTQGVVNSTNNISKTMSDVVGITTDAAKNLGYIVSNTNDFLEGVTSVKSVFNRTHSIISDVFSELTKESDVSVQGLNELLAKLLAKIDLSEKSNNIEKQINKEVFANERVTKEINKIATSILEKERIEINNAKSLRDFKQEEYKESNNAYKKLQQENNNRITAIEKERNEIREILRIEMNKSEELRNSNAILKSKERLQELELQKNNSIQKVQIAKNEKLNKANELEQASLNVINLENVAHKTSDQIISSIIDKSKIHAETAGRVSKQVENTVTFTQDLQRAAISNGETLIKYAQLKEDIALKEFIVENNLEKKSREQIRNAYENKTLTAGLKSAEIERSNLISKQVSLKSTLNSIESELKEKYKGVSKDELERKIASDDRVQALKSELTMSGTAVDYLDDIIDGTKSQLSLNEKSAGLLEEIAVAEKERLHQLEKQNIAKKVANGLDEKARSLLGDSYEEITEIGHALKESMVSPMALVGTLAGMALGAYQQIGKTTREFLNTTGLTVSQTEHLSHFAHDTALELRDQGVEMKNVLDAAGALYDEYGSLNAVTDATVEKVTLLGKAFGVSAQNAAGVIYQMQASTGASAETAGNIAALGAKFAEAAGVAPDAVMKDIAASSESIATYFKGTPKDLMRTAVEARRLGLSLNQVADVSKALLNFDTSIEDQMTASVLLGREINLDKARELALSGDILGATQETLKQIGSLAEFNQLNAVQKEAIAKAAGMQVSELQQSLQKQETLNDMTSEQRAEYEKNLRLLGQGDKMSAEKLLKEQRNQLTQEKIADAMAKISEILANVILPVVEPIAKAFADMLSFIQPIMPALSWGLRLFVGWRAALLGINLLTKGIGGLFSGGLGIGKLIKSTSSLGSTMKKQLIDAFKGGEKESVSIFSKIKESFKNVFSKKEVTTGVKDMATQVTEMKKATPGLTSKEALEQIRTEKKLTDEATKSSELNNISKKNSESITKNQTVTEKLNKASKLENIAATGTQTSTEKLNKVSNLENVSTTKNQTVVEKLNKASKLENIAATEKQTVVESLQAKAKSETAEAVSKTTTGTVQSLQETAKEKVETLVEEKASSATESLQTTAEEKIQSLVDEKKESAVEALQGKAEETGDKLLESVTGKTGEADVMSGAVDKTSDVSKKAGEIDKETVGTKPGAGIKDFLTNLADGLKAMGQSGVLKGIGNTALAGPAFMLAIPSIPFLMFMGKVQLNLLGINFQNLALGLQAMGQPGVSRGIGNSLLLGPALITATIGLPFLLIFGKIGLNQLLFNFENLALGLEAMGLSGITRGLGNMLIAGPALASATVGLPFLLIFGKINLTKLLFNLENLALGLQAMNGTKSGATSLLIAGPALALATVGLPFLLMFGNVSINRLLPNLTSLGLGLRSMNGTTAGAAALLIASPALALATVGLPFLLIFGKVGLNQLLVNFTNLGLGLQAMASTLLGSSALAAFGLASVIALPSLVFLAGIAVLATPGAAGLQALAVGINAFGAAAANPFFWIGIGALAAFGAALIPLGYALNLAAPGIEAFGKAIKSAFEGIATVVTAVTGGLTNMFTALGNIDIAHLLSIGPALLGIGAGLAALGAGGAVGAVGGAISKLFGGGGPIEMLTRLAELGDPLKMVSDSMQGMAASVETLVTSLSNLNTSQIDAVNQLSDAFESLAVSLAEVSLAGLLALPILKGLDALGIETPSINAKPATVSSETNLAPVAATNTTNTTATAQTTTTNQVSVDMSETNENMNKLLNKIDILITNLSKNEKGTVLLDAKKVGEVLGLSTVRSYQVGSSR